MATELASNIFSKGLNADITVNTEQSESYIDARNIRIITDNNASSYAITNVKGNALKFSLPGTSEVVTLKYSGTLPPAAVTVTINGTGVLFTPVSSTLEDLYVELAAFINANYGGIYLTFSRPEDVILYTVAAVPIAVTFSVAGWTSTTVVQQLSNHRFVGSASIRDTLVLLTTNSVDANPGGVDTANLIVDPSSAGQIWTVTFDPITDIPTITLRYNNILNLTQFWGIPNPGGIIPRYEIESIQKIYWTDWFNVPRSFNVADPNGFAIEPLDMDIAPDVTLSVPILQEVEQQGGQLPAGVYQTSYRLKKSSGAQTTFSLASNLVNVLYHPENGPFIDIDGSVAGQATSKALTFTINDLDLDYDRIEVVSIYRATVGGVPEINIVIDEPIGASTSQDFTITGLETEIPITLDDFLAVPITFRKVKTMATKNNYLLPANVIYNKFEVSGFDARAYRYTGGGSPGTYSNTDDINPNQDPFDNTSFIFQDDGVTYGGTGAMISYRFTDQTDVDSTILLDSHLVVGDGYPPYYNLAPDSLTFDLQTTYEQYQHIDAYRDFKSPYIASALRGYMRDETYRFGIVFYSKKGVASYVEWIGDIRMPHHFMPDPNTSVRTSIFPSTICSTPVTYAYLQGIEFTVDISTVRDQISGFSIVRVKRKDADKTVLGQGVLYPGLYSTSAGTTNTLPDDTVWYTDANVSVSSVYASLNSPDFLFSKPPGYRNGDFIDIVSLVDFNERFNLLKIDYTSLGVFKKGYKCMGMSAQAPREMTVVGQAKALLDATILAQNPNSLGDDEADYGPALGLPGSTFLNRSQTQLSPNSMGSKTLLLKGDFVATAAYASTLDDIATPGGGSHVYLANYKRPNLSQYGGNTAADKSKNVYISTGHYQPVDDTTADVTTHFVFGGDTYVCAFDNIKQFPNEFGAGTYAQGVLVGYIVPIETGINIDLRRSPNNRVFNQNALTGGNGGIELEEEFDYIPLYDSENDLRSFIPKPIPFIEVNEFDTRIHGSGAKVNGELVDSWSNFKSNVFIDVDGAYGPINSLVVNKENIYFFQNTGFGTVAANTRLLVQDVGGAELQLGTSGLLSRYDYVSTEVGCKHRWAVTIGNTHVYFFDSVKKRIVRLNDEKGLTSLSDIKGLSAYFRYNLIGDGLSIDRPLLGKGALFAFDFRFNEALFTWLSVDGTEDKSFTIAYNELVEAYTSKLDFVPNNYISHNSRLFSTVFEQYFEANAGRYGQFFGITFPSKVSHIINKWPTSTKMYDVFTWVTQVFNEATDNTTVHDSTWNSVRVYNDHQNSDWITINTKPNPNYNAAHNRKREWTMHVPRNAVKNALTDVDVLDNANLDITQTFKPRISDTYAIAEWQYDNSDNYKFIAPFITTSVRKVF